LITGLIMHQLDARIPAVLTALFTRELNADEVISQIANKLSIVVVQTRKYDSIYFFRQQYAKKQGNLHFVYKLHLYFSILFSK
ncbi:plasmid partitioning/stability family protein, partial [Klebsiella pneumoniae]|uniref:plasmid partitioning/stability family protein n=1 Tax=Klebsiella pneumoniae TaxID=573 RepID=UPI001D034CD1